MDLERMKNWFCQPNEPAAPPAVELSGTVAGRQAGSRSVTVTDCSGLSVRRQCSRGVHSALKSISRRSGRGGSWSVFRQVVLPQNSFYQPAAQSAPLVNGSHGHSQRRENFMKNNMDWVKGAQESMSQTSDLVFETA